MEHGAEKRVGPLTVGETYGKGFASIARDRVWLAGRKACTQARGTGHLFRHLVGQIDPVVGTGPCG